MTQYDYPFNIDSRGRTASASDADHIKQLIQQVLFTAPGERVNRPTFGSGINQLLFAPNSSELATATQFLVQGALQQWLGDLIHVEAVTVTHDESKLQIFVQYIIKRSQQRERAEFVQETS
jgi:uncharacterized protein